MHLSASECTCFDPQTSDDLSAAAHAMRVLSAAADLLRAELSAHSMKSALLPLMCVRQAEVVGVAGMGREWGSVGGVVVVCGGGGGARVVRG